MNPVHQASLNVHQIPDQLMQKRNKLFIGGALAIATVAIPILYSMFKSSHSFDSCSVSSDLSISPKTVEQHEEYCKQFTAGIKKIGGIPLEKISEFAQTHGVFGNRTLQEKLFEDCIKGQKMGTTNEELADHLSAILHSKQWTHDFESEILYDPILLPKSTIGKCSKLQSVLKGDHINADNCIEAGLNVFNEATVPCVQKWHRIENQRNKIGMRITDEMIARIREGLYDGFDPIDVVALLTGHSINSIKQTIGFVTPKNDINKVLSLHAWTNGKYRYLAILPLFSCS